MKNLRMLLADWGLTKLKIKVPFLEAELAPQPSDQQAAWELYVELITRVATQPLPDEHGDEKAALESVYQLFSLTREVLKQNRGCDVFAKVAIPMLNQVIRPFTAKWHKVSLAGGLVPQTGLDRPGMTTTAAAFRDELAALQCDLLNYARLLAELAMVEDLTDIEDLTNPEN
ncbi:MAG: hypothetical protein HQL66_05340 [Magnetococcales bacterium]|nr:hypothetical protein [Magnetococcales bacterium]